MSVNGAPSRLTAAASLEGAAPRRERASLVRQKGALGREKGAPCRQRADFSRLEAAPRGHRASPVRQGGALGREKGAPCRQRADFSGRVPPDKVPTQDTRGQTPRCTRSRLKRSAGASARRSKSKRVANRRMNIVYKRMARRSASATPSTPANRFPWNRPTAQAQASRCSFGRRRREERRHGASEAIFASGNGRPLECSPTPPTFVTE